MSKFEVGDKVKTNTKPGNSLVHGLSGTIVFVGKHGLVDILLDDQSASRWGSNKITVETYCLDLVPEPLGPGSSITLGRKDDKGKPRWSLVPNKVMGLVVQALEYGAKRYGDDNWKHVPDSRTRYYDAARRHIDSWWDGEHLDPESGLPHLAHATCCLLFLLWGDAK